MKRLFFLSLLMLLALSSCRDDIVLKNNPENVFLAFWNTMNENYPFFKERNIEWSEIRKKYGDTDIKSERQLRHILKKTIHQLIGKYQ